MLNLPRNKFQCCRVQQHVHKVEPSSAYCSILFFQLATLKFVARQVEYAVVIREDDENNVCSSATFKRGLGFEFSSIVIGREASSCRFWGPTTPNLKEGVTEGLVIKLAVKAAGVVVSPVGPSSDRSRDRQTFLETERPRGVLEEGPNRTVGIAHCGNSEEFRRQLFPLWLL